MRELLALDPNLPTVRETERLADAQQAIGAPDEGRRSRHRESSRDTRFEPFLFLRVDPLHDGLTGERRSQETRGKQASPALLPRRRKLGPGEHTHGPRLHPSCAIALERLVGLVDSPSNGVTFCTGSLGPRVENDLPAMIRSIGGRDRINFVHCRNVLRTAERDFHESPHPSSLGSVDMREVLRALREVGFAGPMRPDHGRMIWGETGRPGYGLYDRALGATYLLGLWEGLGEGVALGGSGGAAG